MGASKLSVTQIAVLPPFLWTTIGKELATIILHSGSYDRASYALSLAQVALASEMEVHMLLTFEGLRRFTTGHLADHLRNICPHRRH